MLVLREFGRGVLLAKKDKRPSGCRCCCCTRCAVLVAAAIAYLPYCCCVSMLFLVLALELGLETPSGISTRLKALQQTPSTSTVQTHCIRVWEISVGYVLWNAYFSKYMTLDYLYSVDASKLGNCLRYVLRSSILCCRIA